MQLAIPILHHPYIHGFSNQPYIGHYMCHDTVPVDIFISCCHNRINQKESDIWLNMIKNNLNIEHEKLKTYEHPVRNYWKIVKEPKIELVERVRLTSGEDVCIIKTHIIKQIQRKWRNILNSRVNPGR